MEPNCVRYSTGRKGGRRRPDKRKLAARQAEGPRGGVEERKEEWGSRDAGIPDQTVLSSPLRVL